MTNTVNVSVNNRIATVEMNRPEALNALNVEMLKDLSFCLKEISTSDEIDIVVLTGKGRAFSAGGDIKSMLTMADETNFYPIMDSINELVINLYTLPKLTISAISGAAAGLGLSLALATDYTLSDQSAKIAMNFIGIGLIPDGGAHFFLEKRLGENRAKQLIWEGKPLSSLEALEIGLVHEVAAENIQTALEKKVANWLKQPIKAMLKTKEIYTQLNRSHLVKVLELEKQGQYEVRQTKDHAEGIKAFIEKRQPHFVGK